MSELPAQLGIGFIGAGRLGKALAWSLSAAGLRITHVTSAGGQQAAALAARIPSCEPGLIPVGAGLAPAHLQLGGAEHEEGAGIVVVG